MPTFTLIHGKWRSTYPVCAVVALYLNVFVLIEQTFLKFPILNGLAPTQTELSIARTQGAALVGFVGIGNTT